MSELLASVDNTENSGGAEEFDVYHVEQEDALYMYINNFDVEVDIQVEASYRRDKDLSDAITLSSSGFSAVAGESESSFLSEPWEYLRFTVTPTADPTSGSFDLRRMR